MFSFPVLIAILIVVNIPLYALLSWIMFDNLRENSSSIIGGLLKTCSLLVSGYFFFYIIANHDEDNSMFSVIVVLIASALAIYGEYQAINSWWPSLIAS